MKLFHILSFACALNAHPNVSASNNIIDIDVRGSTDYYGPLFVGQDFTENYMIYDTMSEWTVILNKDADN